MSILNGAGFVADAIGSVSSYLMNEQSAETSRKWQGEQNRQQQIWQTTENQRQREWEEKMWNMSNAYNTPSAQRARLREAGFSPWQSGGGGAGIAPNLAASHGSPSAGSPSMVGAPSFPTMRNPAENMQSVLNESIRIDAESANQLAQAAQNAVMTSVALYEKTGDISAASRYLNTSLKAVGGANFSDNSLYFRQFQLAIIGADLDNSQKKLDIDYSTLKNDIYSKYGSKEAESKIANLEQLTTKYVGELGLMSSKADLNRSEIALNEKRAYELGAKAASEFAQAKLFGSETSINTGMANYLIGNANLSFLSNLMNTNEQLANFVGDTGKREYIMSEEGQNRRTWNYKQSPEGNYVSSFMKGFVDNSNTSFNFGGNYNYSRSFNNSRGYTNSWIWNGRDFAPHH